MIWKILGIEKTSDRRKIIAAYREKLSVTNPEDHPEEFKQLRDAYEEALKYADSIIEDDHDKSPVELWKDQLAAVYNDFQKRIDVDAWKQLLSADVCRSIDTRMAVEDALLTFFLDSYFMSHDVWVYLNEEFHFIERQQELNEKYPPAFVQNILINGTLYDDILPLNMFDPGKDGQVCEEYLRLYNTLRSGKYEDPQELITRLAGLSEKHPYGQALIISFEAFHDQPEKANELISLHEQYPEDITIAMLLLPELHHQEKYTEEIAICKKMLEIYPENHQLKYRYGDALAAVSDYDGAINQINDLLRSAGGNQQYIYDLDMKRKEWAEKLIEQTREKLAEDLDNDKIKVDLAWAYLENYQDQEAQKLVETIREENTDPFDYHNLKGNTAVSAEQYETAIEHFLKLIEVIINLPEDGDARTRRNKSRLGETYGRLGYLYYLTDNQEKQDEMYEIALKTAKDKLAILTQMCFISLRKRSYDRLLEYSEMLIKEDQSAYQGYLYKAYACFHKQMDAEAYQAVNRSLELCRTDLDCYILKARILMVNRAYDEAKKIIDFLLSNHLEDVPGVLYLQGYYTELADSNDQQALEKYNRALEIIGDNGENFTFMSELCYRALYLTGNISNANDQADRTRLLEIADKGLKYNPDYYGLLDYKAWLLTRGEQYEEALKIYRKLAENPSHGPKIDAQIGYIYYQDLKHHADKALDYYKLSLEKGGNHEAHFYIGMCYMYMNRLDEAEKHFMLLREKEPDELDSYYRMSTLHQMRREYYEALADIHKTIEIDSTHQNPSSYYYYCLVQLLRRMGKMEQAVTASRQMLEKFGTGYAYKLIFDIYIQFGAHTKAAAYLKEWRRTKKENADRLGCETTLELLKNNMFMARLKRTDAGNMMNRNRALDLDATLARNDGKFAQEFRLFENAIKDSNDLSRIYGSLAYSAFHLNDREKQHEYAQKALEVLEERLSEYRNDELLYLVRKAKVLALLDRRKEAEAILKEAETHRLCIECPYSTCKDRYIYAAEIEEIFGNRDKALKLAQEGNERFPDEEDFVVMANMIKKKEKRK